MSQIDIFNTENKYPVILCDAPWSFKTYTDAGKDRSADNHYSVMSIEDLKKLPIGKLAAPNSLLFHWVTFPLLKEGISVMEAWGFKYVTCAFNWIKMNKSADPTKVNIAKDIFMGMGYYVRSNSELCLLGERESDDQTDIVLLGRKGPKALERKSKSIRQVILSHRREHSQKPEEMYERIETLYDGPYLELFARNERVGWDCFGNETNKFNG